MKEEFLHYIWRKGAFRIDELRTHDGRPVQLLHPGDYHHDAGPDFSGARLKIGAEDWVGSVEIHVKSSDWLQHGHQSDPAYESVILHVVWENDAPIHYASGGEIPTLELRARIDDSQRQAFDQLHFSLYHVPCLSLRGAMREDVVRSAFQDAGVQRLEQKAEVLSQTVACRNYQWEQLLFSQLCRSLGSRVNAEPMEQLGNRIDLNKIDKLSNQKQIEAMLFGVSGLLKASAEQDEYCKQLMQEFAFYRLKWSMESMPAVQWKYLRMRPISFPDMRIAMLASLLFNNARLFASIKEVNDPMQLKAMFQVEASHYWREHYRLGQASATHAVRLGDDAIQLILINAVAPVLYTYGQLHRLPAYCDRAVRLLRALGSENNALSREWSKIGFKPANALESQGILHLNRQFCTFKHCLSCEIGQSILKNYGRN